ncbi:M16 family metallopeptidase [Cetobacterium ceti]
MNFKKFYFLFIFLLYSTIGFGTSLEDSKNLLEGTLPNGLHYYILKNEKPENRASLNLVVSSGSLNEEDDQQGLAHFLEHMAFNGTTKYKKNDLIKYLQSLGLDFGGDLNAYTSFGETVYKLQVPTSEKDLDTGLEVLREWASEITLDPKAIDNEKGVILEEWRLRQGLTQRIGDIQKKILFGNSRYFHRFPIGLPENIKSANHNLLNSYYKKWYQPRNMAVIAVGDFDPNMVENIIKKYFNYKGDDNFTSGVNYTIENNFKKSTTIFTDPEITGVSLNFICQSQNAPINTMDILKKSIARDLYLGILNTQFSIISKENNSPIISGGGYSYNIGKKDRFNMISLDLRENDITSGIEKGYSLVKYLGTKPISLETLNLEKTDYLSGIKNFVKNKKSIQNNTYIDMIKNKYLYGDTFINPEDELSLTENILKTITPEDIENIAKEFYQENTAIFLIAPEKDNLNIPSKEVIDSIVDKIRSSSLDNLKLNNTLPKLEKLNLIPGKIITTDSNKDCTIYTLSNGIKVYYKHTDFDKDKISIRLFKEEGSSNEDYDNYINSIVAPYLISNSGIGNLTSDQMEIFMKGKNFSVTPYITDYEEGFYINSDMENLGLSLDFFRLMINNPKIDKDIFNNLMNQLKEEVKNKYNSPKALYRDKVSSILSNNNPRRKSLDESDLSKISEAKVLNIFKKKFNNFNNYKIVIVGSLNDTEARNEITKYFASLPVKSENNKPQPLGITFPKNIIKDSVTKGVDKKATVTLVYPYEGTYSNENRTLYNASSKILDMILIEEIREKLGGVYSIYSVPDLEPYNYGENSLKIFFSTKISRTEEITEATKTVVDNFINGKIDQKKIDDIITNYKLTYETAIRKNQYWSQYLYKKSFIPDYKVLTPKEYNSFINYENMVKFLKTAVNKDNYIQITLLPEREE